MTTYMYLKTVILFVIKLRIFDEMVFDAILSFFRVLSHNGHVYLVEHMTSIVIVVITVNTSEY